MLGNVPWRIWNAFAMVSVRSEAFILTDTIVLSYISYRVVLLPALHQERVSHVFTGTDGLHNPHGLIEDIEHKLLENDLALQAALRHDTLATVHMQEDSMAAYGMTSPYHSSTLNAPTVLDGGLDEESSEALMICVVIAGLALLPQFLGN